MYDFETTKHLFRSRLDYYRKSSTVPPVISSVLVRFPPPPLPLPPEPNAGITSTSLRSAHAIRPFPAASTTVVVCFFAAFRTITRSYRNDPLLSARNSTGPCNFLVPFKTHHERFLLVTLNYYTRRSHISRFNNGLNFLTISLIPAVFFNGHLKLYTATRWFLNYY